METITDMVDLWEAEDTSHKACQTILWESDSDICLMDMRKDMDFLLSWMRKCPDMYPNRKNLIAAVISIFSLVPLDYIYRTIVYGKLFDICVEYHSTPFPDNLHWQKVMTVCTQYFPCPQNCEKGSWPCRINDLFLG